MNPGSRFFLNVRVKSLFLPLGDIIYLKFYFLFLFFYSYSIILYRSYKWLVALSWHLYLNLTFPIGWPRRGHAKTRNTRKMLKLDFHLLCNAFVFNVYMYSFS
jgi:hypothetical protein